MLKPGLYEQIISQSLSRELASVSDACKHVEKLDAAEAPQALAGYVAEAVRAALEAMPAGTEEQSVQRIALVNKLLTAMGVSGRGILAAVMPVMRLGSFSCRICSSFSARSSTDFSLRSSRC